MVKNELNGGYQIAQTDPRHNLLPRSRFPPQEIVKRSCHGWQCALVAIAS